MSTRLFVTLAFVAALLAPVRSAADLPATIPAAGTAAAELPRGAAALSIMTYNVHGLPWPLAQDRARAFREIAAQLRALRARGAQPRVVLLQEAFTADAQRIGRAAGYRYARFGPASGTPAPASRAADAAFADRASFLHGEGIGKLTGSGLSIFSDYPITAARKLAFPVCAGFDCLANKGVLAVRIALPGSAASAIVVDTHLNAKAASGVDLARSTFAYAHQVSVLAAFVRRIAPPDAALFIGGDFNVGQSDDRRRYLASALGRIGVTTSPIHQLCVTQPGCLIEDGPIVAGSARRNKDWLMFRPLPHLDIAPVALGAPISGWLSDHIAIDAAYTLIPRRARA